MLRLLPIALILILWTGVAQAANYAIEIVSPQAGLTTDDRAYKQYPGIEYNIRMAVRGGKPPFVFDLTTSPSGMTIDADTGEVTWANPVTAGSPHSVTARVTDDESSTDTVSWTITVTTSGFLFLDATGGSPSGAGTIGDPMQQINDFYNTSKNDSAYDGYHVYFRAGTYHCTGCEQENGIRTLLREWKPNVWLEYPGEAVILDLNGIYLQPQGPSYYFDGFEIIDGAHHLFRIASDASDYLVIRRTIQHDVGPGADGSNSSFILTTSEIGGSQGVGLVVQNNELYAGDDIDCLKIYYQNKIIIEDNLFHDFIEDESPGDACIAMKSTISNWTIRGNTFTALPASMAAIGGNMHDDVGGTFNGEILYNNVQCGPHTEALWLNQDGLASSIFIERNTFCGRVRIGGDGDGDSADGPFTFTNNIVEDDEAVGQCVAGYRHYCFIAGDAAQVTMTASPNQDIHCSPAENCIDDNGLLVGAYRTSYLGSKGYELGVVASTVGPGRGRTTGGMFSGGFR